MKFTRTVKITRVRREVVVPVAGPGRCPNCGCELPAAPAPSLPMLAGPDEVQQTVPKAAQGEEMKFAGFCSRSVPVVGGPDIGRLRPAPGLTSQALSTGTIEQSGAQATVIATVKISDKVTRVSAAALDAGMVDHDMSQPVMVDDGTQGDVVAGDGIYSSNQLGSDCCSVLGAHTVRVKAEVRDSENRRHATAIEFGGLTVLKGP